MTLTTWIPRGTCPAHDGESHGSYWMLSTCLKQNRTLNPLEEPGGGREEPAMPEERVRKALWPGVGLFCSGRAPACGSAARGRSACGLTFLWRFYEINRDRLLLHEHNNSE